ncbi:MAG: hypothetical protein REI11_12260 [Patulibacter sp.]|nr:hypothetical protein [Patulibacter sp.]
MKFDRTFLLRHADAAGVAAIDRAEHAATSLIDEPTREMPRIVDFGAGRGNAGPVRISVRAVERGDHAAALHHAARLRG